VKIPTSRDSWAKLFLFNSSLVTQHSALPLFKSKIQNPKSKISPTHPSSLIPQHFLPLPLSRKKEFEKPYRYAYVICKTMNGMTAINVTAARAKLYQLIDETVSSHKPIVIRGKRGNAVLLSESDWNAISETLHLLSIPGMRESIQEGIKEEITDCSKELDW
jgi:antitoxin YefM